MPLSSGTRLGPYEVGAQIGAGGMGEVYRATDTNLKREVAIKVLPASVAGDAERLARFQREAEVLAALNHPNIAAIYGLEKADRTIALVMELVEGSTLADRIAQGAIPLDEALYTARQIAEALETAHEQGIIHRDLKPANIKVRPDGTVKVLDFGLAAVAQGASAIAPDVTNSPTLTLAATRAGVILGTAGYMSPEQAAGKPVDKRADIWSFGVVLWEMLTGARLFDGESVSHTLADVLRAEVDFNRLSPETPQPIRVVLQRCLDRDVKARLRDIGEARVALQRYLADPAAARATSSAAAASARRPMMTTVALGVAAIAMAAAAGLAWVHFREQPPVTTPVRFEMPAPAGAPFSSTGVLSPDGRSVAFDAPGPDGRQTLWVRSFDVLEARPLAGTEGVSPGPIWSPDSRFLAFGVNGFPGQLKKVAVSGGPPQTLCEYPRGGFREGTWNSAGVILFGAALAGVMSVPESGGRATLLTKIDASRQEIQHAGPVWLPDGRRFLYHRASRVADNTGIYIGSSEATPESQSTTRLLATDSDPVYVPASDGSGDDFILFLRQGALLAQAFDGARLLGDPIRVSENVGTLGSYGWFSASPSGALAFRAGSTGGAKTDLVWFDRKGQRLGQLGPSLDLGSNVQLSPDGKRVAITRGALTELFGALGNIQGARIWTAELSRAIFSRLTPGEGIEVAPAISPDGHVAFSSSLKGVGDLYWTTADGTGTPEPLLENSPTVKHPNGFSPDGKFLIYDDHTTQRQDLWILPITAPPNGQRKPIPFVVTQADESFGQFSPDGRWIAYSSDESGRLEVYVQGFAPDRVPAAAGGKWLMSTAGGDKPRWSRDGNELYYIAPDRKLMAVPVTPGPPFQPGVAVPLFETRATGFFPYDVSPDGRFLLSTPAAGETSTSSPLTIVLNWQAGLKR
jgi:eukaryotic-like serine/threonine-protein kinase